MSEQATEYGSNEWTTDRELARMLGRFDLDPCSNDRSHIESYARCALEPNVHRDIVSRDGLTFDWTSVRPERGVAPSVFLNWPYSDPLPWARKVVEHPGPWAVLAKLDPSTKWWAVLMEASPTVTPFRKRLKFERPDKPPMTANFPSVLIYSAWRPSRELAERLWLPTYATRAA